jgi:hypothetical protein
VGFRIWGRAADDEWKLLSELIASSGEDSHEARRYQQQIEADPSIVEVRLEDVDVLGASRFHPPLRVGESRGSEPIPARIDWGAIRASNAADTSRRMVRDEVEVLAMVRRDGVQQVSVTDLLTLDTRFAGANAAELAVHDNGQPVPRHVDCVSLQAGCRIEFFGRARQSLYGAERAYTISLDGIRARPTQSGRALAGSGAPRVYEDEVRDYSNRIYSSSAPGTDPWYDARIQTTGAPASASRSFVLGERAPGPVRLTVDVWGGLDFPGSTPDHHVQILVNGQTLTERWFDGFTAERIEVAIPESLLLASNTLSVRVPRDTGYSADVVLLDGYSVRYPRRSHLNGTELRQGQIDPVVVGTGTGLFADGFEVATSAPARFQIDGHGAGAVLWSVVDGDLRRDPLPMGPVLVNAASEAWWVATPAAVQTPTLQPSASAYELPAALDYLVITHPLFEQGLAPLLALQASRGLSTAVLRTDQIYAAHSRHVRDPAAIRSAIAAAAARGARFVLLVGGDSYDYHDYLGAGSQSYLPTWYVQTSRYIFHAASDHPYVDLDGSGHGDLAIGRLPVRSSVELARAIDAILARGNGIAERFLSVAGASQPGEHFALHGRTLLSYLRQPGQQRAYALADEIGTVSARNLARQGLEGQADWISYIGHSSPHRWAFDNLLDTSQLASIQRSGSPAIVSQWGCWNNAFALPLQDTMAHALMLRENRLAAAVLGATSLVEDASHLALATRFFDLVEDGRLQAHSGPAIRTIGEALRLAKHDLVEREPSHRSAAFSIVLFGDPAMPLQP